MQNDAQSLAGMGIRAVLEHIMISKVKDRGTFKSHVDALAQNGFVSQVQSSYLVEALNIGDAAMHRAHRPDVDKIVTCMDIMENVLQSLYVLPRSAKTLGKGVPKRKKRNRK